MNPHEEIAQLRRRIGGVEFDVQQLKLRLAALEAQIAPAPMDAPASAPPVAVAPEVFASPVPLMAEPPPLEAPLEPAGEPLPPVAPVREPPPPRPNPLREWLEPLQLWPPAGEENAEVRLAAWWATRLGALLAVIGIVFLGVYVSGNASPWVRLAEVAGVSCGALMLGAWLERTLPKFGAVVVGAGLALAYFCAFAAYAVEPMKVVSNPAVAIAIELAVVAGILAIAWWRGSHVIATMAVALGHVTAFLALREASAGFGPWVVLLLAAAAVIFRLTRGWPAPSALAMPLTWLFLAVIALGGATEPALLPLAAWCWGMLYFAVFMMRDWIVAWKGRVLSTTDRAVQIGNSSLAVAVGLLIAANAGGDALHRFYFGSGVVMLAAMFAWRAAPGGAALVSVLACKGAGLIALGIIAVFEGHARSLVLLAQAFVMLASARQSHTKGLRIATILAGAVALGFFLGELRPEGAQLASAATSVEVAFLAGGVAFVAALRRWLDIGRTAAAFGSVIMGAVSIATSVLWAAPGWTPAVSAGLGALLFLAAAAVRGWQTAAIVGSMLAIAAHAQMWRYPAAASPVFTLWLNELVLLATAVAAGVGFRWIEADDVRRKAHGLVIAIAGSTFLVVCFNAMPPPAALSVAAILSALLVASTRQAPRWPVAALSTLLLACGVVLYASYQTSGYSAWLVLAAVAAWVSPVWLVASPIRLESIQDARWRSVTPALQTTLALILTLLAIQDNLRDEARVVATMGAALLAFALTWRPGLRPALEAGWVLWLAVFAHAAALSAGTATWLAFAAAWLPAIALSRSAGFAPLKTAPPQWRPFAAGVQVALAASIGLVVALDFDGPMRLVALGAITIAAWAVWRWGGVEAARPAAITLAAAAWIAAGGVTLSGDAQDWGFGVGSVLGIAALIAAMPFAIDGGLLPSRRRLRWFSSAAGLALAIFAFVTQRGEIAPYATVGCGLAAVALFLAGLFAGSRPHRLVGLAGLAFCVPRAFAVDLDSTLHRIAAFVALGVVLLWVGFSYHRFRHLIVDEDKNR